MSGNSFQENRRMVPPFRCKYCGAPSWVDPSDQTPPPAYCHESDHGEPELMEGTTKEESPVL